MNAVESFLLRLQLGQYIPDFKANNIDKVATLRQLTDDQLQKLIPDPSERSRLREALQRNQVEPPGPIGSSQPQRVVASDSFPPPYKDAESEQRVALGSGHGPKICRFYRTPQGCKKGENCNLIHSDDPNAAPGQRPGGNRQQKIKVCREFFSSGCPYGDSCRYSHDPQEQYRQPGSADSGEALGSVAGTDTAEVTVTIPTERIKLLLAQKAAKLNEINRMYGTTNSRITKPEEFRVNYTFALYGTKENVEKAKAEIERLAGIKRSQLQEQRFNYTLNEYERNVQSVEYLAMANVLNKDGPRHLPDALLHRICNTFRFERQSDFIEQLWNLSGHTDKEKFDLVMKFTQSMKCIQAIIFCSKERVEQMEKRANNINIPDVTPQFMHRDMPKDQRMKSLEAFKAGQVNASGRYNRLLITTDDYAKYARKIELPYVNFIVHFNVPKTKELYLARVNCTGRHGKRGLSLMFVGHNDATTQRDWSEVLPLKEFRATEAQEDFAAAVSKLDFDAEDNKLTADNADPDPNAPKEEKKKKVPAAPTA